MRPQNHFSLIAVALFSGVACDGLVLYGSENTTSAIESLTTSTKDVRSRETVMLTVTASDQAGAAEVIEAGTPNF